MRHDQRRGETFHELRQAQEVARQGRPRSGKGTPPAVGRIIRIALIALFGVVVLWLLQEASVPPLVRTIALAAVGITILFDILRLLFD